MNYVLLELNIVERRSFMFANPKGTVRRIKGHAGDASRRSDRRDCGAQAFGQCDVCGMWTCCKAIVVRLVLQTSRDSAPSGTQKKIARDKRDEVICRLASAAVRAVSQWRIRANLFKSEGECSSTNAQLSIWNHHRRTIIVP